MVNSAHKITKEGYKDIQELPAGICQTVSPQSAKKFSPGQGTSQITPAVDTGKNTPNENIQDAEASPTYSTEEILLCMMSRNDNPISQHTLIGDL